MFRLKNLVCLWSVVVCLCRLSFATHLQAHASAAPADASSVIVRQLAYRFSFAHPGRIHVSLEADSPSSGSEPLDLPSRWADARNLEDGIQNLKITGSEVALEPTARPSRLTLHAKPDTRFRLDYDLVQDWSGLFRPGVRHRVLLQPNLVEFNGENALVAPRLAAAAPVHVTFDFVDLASGRTIVTSFGTDPHQAVTGRWSDVTNALFVAGDLTTRRVPVLGGPVLVATAGHWSFSEQELALKIHEILGAERLFWQTPPPPFYAVVLIPFETGTSGGGGSAFTHAFGLALAPGETFDPETESLFAHEAFHAWNPTALGPVADPQHLAWFIEGFTTYYQDVLLARTGLLSPAGYFKRLNAVLRDYFTSPAAAQPINSGGSTLDDDESRIRMPYLRGAVLALWLNAEIVRQTQDQPGGPASLDDLMRALAAEHVADPALPLTADRIVTTAGRFVNAPTLQSLRSFLQPEAEIPLPRSPGACAIFRPQLLWTFDLGLPLADLALGASLHDVDPTSAAFRAGVRDGQTLLGWSLWHGDADHEVVLTVRTTIGSPVQRLTYLPRGRQVTIPQAELVPGCTTPTAPPLP